MRMEDYDLNAEAVKAAGVAAEHWGKRGAIELSWLASAYAMAFYAGARYVETPRRSWVPWSAKKSRPLRHGSGRVAKSAVAQILPRFPARGDLEDEMRLVIPSGLFDGAEFMEHRLGLP